jgi:macrolide phosphotransferase
VRAPDPPPATRPDAGGDEAFAGAARWANLARSAAPGLAIRPLRLIENGWDSRVLHAADGEGRPWIFRFPRRDEVAGEMAGERRLLRLLRGRLGVAVPEWQVDAVVDGQLVVGYPTLPGHPAAYEPEGTGDFRYVIPLPPPRDYARTLAAALVRLHSVEVAAVADGLGTAVPTARAIRDDHAGLLRRCAATFPEGAALADQWESQLADDGLWDFAPTLRHGDVHPEHTMVDDRARLTGIIDWTDSGLGDPAADFVDPRFAFGPRFGALLLADYAAAGGVVGERLAERVAVLQSWGPAQAALFGLDHGRAEVTARALARLARQAGR